jgi:hypothetical protein
MGVNQSKRSIRMTMRVVMTIHDQQNKRGKEVAPNVTNQRRRRSKEKGNTDDEGSDDKP